MLIVKPVITEKTMRIAQNLNQYTFEVSQRANKIEAAKELSNLFNVEVVNVSVNNRLGKTTRFGGQRRKQGRKTDRKIMVFKLKDGNKIDIFSA